MIERICEFGLRGVSGFGKASGVLLMVFALSGTASAVTVVPEIDPGSLATSVGLLMGGTMLFAHSRRRG